MEGRGREIAPGLHRIEAPLGDRFVACYLVCGDDAALLYDTGVADTPAGSILPYCHASGIDPATIRWAVISHCDVDHMGGDAAIATLLPQVQLVAHAADLRLIEDVEAIIEERYREFRDGHAIDIDTAMIDWCRSVARPAPVSIVIDGPTRLELGRRAVQVLPTPGHSDGSISLWDPLTRAALTSDAVLGEGLHLADGRPAFPPTYRRPTPYLATIATIEALEPSWLLTAHEPPMAAEAAMAFLERSRTFTQQLGSAARRELETAGGPLTTQALIERLAPRMGTWDPGVWMFLANGLVGHLEELEAEGVIETDGGRPVSWQLSSARR